MAESEIIRNRQYFKRNKVLNLIRYNHNISRNDVKKLTLYSVSTVRDIIEELINSGLVYEVECDDNRVGRKPIWLHLNPEGAYFIGVEFNARKLHCVMMNISGEIVSRSSEDIETDSSSDAIISIIINHIHNAINKTPECKGKCFGVGVGVPGYIDKKKGIAISYSHLKNWENVPICEIIEKQFSLPCYIDNNVNVMASAYKWLYYNGESKDFIFVSMRTGLHVVPVIDNKLIISRTGFSGELGHIRISQSSRMCTCGQFGCLNSEVADPSLLNIIKEGIAIGRFHDLLKMVENDPSKINMSIFCASVLQNQTDSVRLMQRTAHLVGESLGLLVNIFAPQLIVLSGELTSIGDAFINEVRKAIQKHVVSENLAELEICASVFDKYIGATGAAALVMQEEFEFIDKQI